MIWAPLLAAALDLAAAVPVAAPSASLPATSTTALGPGAPKPGQKAPNFAYQSHDYMRRRFHDMLAQGAVLIVFAPTDADLRALEAERDEMLTRGVVPVAVLDRKDSDVWKVVRRLGLTYSLLSDPRGAIASEFGAWSEPAGHASPAWYVVGGDGRVRARGMGELPSGRFAATAFDALGLPGEVRQVAR